MIGRLRTRWRAVASVGLAGALLWGLTRWVDPAAVLAATAQVPAWRLGAAAALGALMLGVRALRAAVLLPGDVPWIEALGALAVAFLAALVTPFRLGGLVRPAILARRLGVPVPASLLGMVVERGLDAIALAAVLVVVGGEVLVGRGGPALPALGLGAALLLLLALASWRRRAPRSEDAVAPFAEAALGLAGRPARAAGAVVLTPVPFVLGPLAAGLVLSSFDTIPVAPSTLLSFWAAVVTASAAVPTPGGLGGYEAAGTAALAVVGAPVGVAAGATLALHGALLVGQALVGAALLPRVGWSPEARAVADAPRSD